MAIQFGSTAINAIKYCNASGVLQDVSCVLRNDAVVFPPKAAVFCLEGVPAGMTLAMLTGKIYSRTGKAQVDWGDGTIETISIPLSSSQPRYIPPHTYASSGDYTVVISGTLLSQISAVSSDAYPVLTQTAQSGLPYLKKFSCSGLTTIGMYCFAKHSKLKSVVLSESVTTLGYSCFLGCSGLTSLIIPSGVTSFGDYCFWGCSGLTTLTIPSGVTSLPRSCFCRCSGLTSLIIPSGVTTLGQECFWGCSGLTSLTIPSGVTSIGGYCFKNCSGLTSLTCEATTPPTLGTDVFYNVPKSIPVYVPSASISAYQAASGWSDFTNFQPISE